MAHNFEKSKDLVEDPSVINTILGNSTYFAFFYPIYAAQKVFSSHSVNPTFTKNAVRLTGTLDTMRYVKDNLSSNHLWGGYLSYMIYDMAFWTFDVRYKKLLGLDQYIPELETKPNPDNIKRFFKGNLAYKLLMTLLSVPFMNLTIRLMHDLSPVPKY